MSASRLSLVMGSSRSSPESEGVVLPFRTPAPFTSICISARTTLLKPLPRLPGAVAGSA